VKIKFLICQCLFYLSLNGSDWTWTYSMRFDSKMSEQSDNKKEINFSKIEVPEYSQLIFSWNAIRPRKGIFTFWAQFRDSKTKEWQPWYKMMEWGDGFQKSFCSKGPNGSGYYFVRLETGDNFFSDGFRIKVEISGDANLSDLKYCSVCVSNLKKLKFNDENQCYENCESILIRNVPEISQMQQDHPRKTEICSPTSLSMVTNFLSKQNVDTLNFVDNVFDSGFGIYGNWSLNVAHAFEKCGGEFFCKVSRFNSFMELHKYLMQQIPVVVSVRGVLKGAAKEHPGGHLLVVVGWDKRKKQVVCHDPAFENNDQVFHKYEFEDFIKAWNLSRNLVYVFDKNNLN